LDKNILHKTGQGLGLERIQQGRGLDKILILVYKLKNNFYPRPGYYLVLVPDLDL